MTATTTALKKPAMKKATVKHDFFQMVENMPIAVMTCRISDFTIDYMNQKSYDLLETIQHVLSVKPQDMVGTTIDVFHKKPEHQRRLLSDYNNLPHTANIVVADETLSLTISPVFDGKGNYTHAMLSWSVTTEKVKKDQEVEKLMSMLDNMPVNVMMCDPKTLVLTYMNETSLRTLRTVEHLLPIKADQVVGTCIDIFHKNPEHQRRLLGDPNNLPYRAKIKLGDETLDLNAAAIKDKEGNYIAAMVAWSVVTQNVKLADDFETNVKSLVETVASSATEMEATAQTLASAAEETSTQSNVVSAASEELSSSVNEISSQVASSTRIVDSAVQEAAKSEQLVSGLVEAAEKINAVTAIIADIAAQTNLLALNATIEAARAGEAGKGFAVVASEVKKLASETAKATEEIRTQIGDIQNVSRSTATAIQEIARVITEISEISTSISGAVEQQSAATQEVATNITGVQTAANETGQSSSTMLNVAQELSSRSEDLQNRVDAFLASVRAM